MKRDKAIERIMHDLHLPEEMEDFVLQTYGRLTDSADSIDLDTLSAVKNYIKQIMTK